MDRLRGSVKESVDKLLEMKLKTSNVVKILTENRYLFGEAYVVAEKRLLEGGSVMEEVWSSFIHESARMYLSDEGPRRWQLGIVSLFPYVLNLYLAPKRPEFKHVKVGILSGVE